MSSSTCQSCRHFLKTRLRLQISSLQLQRRGLHRASILRQQEESRSEPWTGSLYIDSNAPNKAQRVASNLFFKLHPPRIAWVAGEWRKQANEPKKPAHGGSSMLTPEIAFLGRSNSGKSSLLNALVEKLDLCRVGPTPGKTKDMHAWALAASDPRSGGAIKGMKGEMDDRLIVLDMPGYGHGSRDEWGDDIIKYLRARRQLKRVFVLINVEHGIKKSDEMTLQLLRANGISHQVVACKADTVRPAKLHEHLLGIRQRLHETEQQSTAMGSVLKDILAVGRLGDNKANRKVKFDQMLGVEEVRWAVLRAVGLEGYAETKRLDTQERRFKQQAALNTEKQRNEFASENSSKRLQTHSEAVG